MELEDKLFGLYNLYNTDDEKSILRSRVSQFLSGKSDLKLNHNKRGNLTEDWEQGNGWMGGGSTES